MFYNVHAGWNSPPDCSNAGTIVALTAKIGNANTKPHQKW